MGWRYRKSVKIAPGVRFNLNKDSMGITLGGKALKYTVNTKGRKTVTVGTPVKGLYYTETISNSGKKDQPKDKEPLVDAAQINEKIQKQQVAMAVLPEKELKRLRTSSIFFAVMCCVILVIYLLSGDALGLIAAALCAVMAAACSMRRRTIIKAKSQTEPDPISKVEADIELK